MGYWDIPEGTQCVEKTWIATKIATALGLVGSAYYMALFQPKTVLQGLKNSGGATLTLASLGAIFGITTCVTAQIREKPDDAVNYFIGGCTSGLLLGVRTHNYLIGTSGCLTAGGVAAFAKVANQEGWLWFPADPGA